MVKQLCFLDVLRLELFSIFIHPLEISIEARVFTAVVRVVKTEVNCRNLQKDLIDYLGSFNLTYC